jgi:hypothetical protein
MKGFFVRMRAQTVTDLQIARNAPREEHHDREWWRAEAWPGILRLQIEVVAGWRARHDPDWERVA